MEVGALGHVDPQQLAEAQYEASSTIYGSNDPAEILSAMVAFSGTTFARAHLGLLDTDAAPPRLSILAEGDRDGLKVVSRSTALNNYPAHETLGAVEVLSIADVDSDPFLTDAERDRLRASGIRAALYIPLAVGQRMTGLMALEYAEPREFHPARLRAIRSLADQIAVVFENQTLLREARKSAAQLAQQVQALQTVNQLATGISSFTSERALLDYAVENLVAANGVDHVGLMLFDADGEWGTVVAEYPAQGALNSKLEVRSNPTILALQQDPERPVVIQSVQTDPMLPPHTREVLRGIGIEALMVMPIRIHNRLVGTIGFDIYEQGKSISPSMIELAQTMTAQLSIAIQNIRLFADTQRRAEQLQHIAAFGQSIQATLDLELILNLLLTETRRTITADRISVALFDAAQGQLRIAAQYEDDKTYVDLTGGPLISVSGTFVGQVWETQEMLIIPDTQRSTGIRRMQDVSVRSVMILPIRSRGRLIGTVNVGSLQPDVYSEADVAVFQQMVSQLAAAIENSEAFAQSQRVAQNETLVNAIAAQFQAQTDVQAMMNTAISELGRAIGARRGRVRLTTASGESQG
jgi:GAF domain-containing protein